MYKLISRSSHKVIKLSQKEKCFAVSSVKRLLHITHKASIMVKVKFYINFLFAIENLNNKK